MGLHLRGEYYNLNYKRAALPGDRLRIVTQIEGVAGPFCAVRLKPMAGGRLPNHVAPPRRA